MEDFVTPEQFRIGDVLLLRDFHEDVKVVCHQSIGDDFDHGKLCGLVELFSEGFLVSVFEEHFSVYGSGDAVIDGIRVVRFEASLTWHGMLMG
jgi:hypothetical protein